MQSVWLRKFNQIFCHLKSAECLSRQPSWSTFVNQQKILLSELRLSYIKLCRILAYYVLKSWGLRSTIWNNCLLGKSKANCPLVFSISSFWCPRLCPSLFGHPNQRARSWRVVYNKNMKKWTSSYTLQELVDLILAPQGTDPYLSAKAYCVARGNQLHGYNVREENLSRHVWIEITSLQSVLSWLV